MARRFLSFHHALMIFLGGLPLTIGLGLSGFLVCFLLPLSANAAEMLSEKQARAKAIAILKGNPYGNTPLEVAGRIVEAQMVTAGTVCRGVKVRSPLWQFHVVVPENVVSYGNNAIDGYLVIDARSGKMVCAGLPFLD